MAGRFGPDATPEEIVRQESQFGRLPLLPPEREYGSLGAHATCFAYAVATWCFMIGGIVANRAGAIQGAVALTAGVMVGVFITNMATALACHRYGLEQVDFCKTAFGQRGTRIVLVFYIINQIGWNGLILVMFGNGIRNVARALGYHPGPWIVSVGVVIGLWLTYLLVTRGVHLLNVSNAFITPGLAILTAMMFALLLWRHGWAAIVAAPPLAPGPDPLLDYLLVFEWGVATGISWWGAIGFLARNTRRRRDVVYPQLVQLGLGLCLVCCVSLFSSLVARTDDPTEWMIPIGGPVLGLVALLFVALANVSTSAIQTFTCGLAFRHLGPLKERPWRQLVLWTVVLTLPYAIWPEFLYRHGNTFLSYNGTIYAPICGVLFADYFAVRRGRVDIWGIFEDDPSGAYHYRGGFNWPAIVAVAAGIGLFYALLDPLTFESAALFRWLTASLPVAVASGLIYWGLMALAAWRIAGARAVANRPAGGGFGAVPAPADGGAPARRLIRPNI
jgi:NCS1 family nucleobase:cation symporter-1